jgi:hypothetical protein
MSLYGTDDGSKIRTKKRCYLKENEIFRVYHTDETHSDKDWFSRTSVAVTGSYRTKAQANTLSY